MLLTRLPEGAFGLTARPARRLIARPGRYLLCAWVIEGVFDLQPEAAASYTFRVSGRR